MDTIFELVGLLVVAFAISFTLAWLWSRRPKPVKILPLHENTSVRMVGQSGVYRCTYLRRSPKGLVFSAPLQRNVHVPITVGELMMIQAPVAESVITFRSKVVSRNGDTHEFTLENPERFRHVDRRAEKRDTTLGGTIIRINHNPGCLVNLSAQGARILTTSHIQPGDVICLELGGESEEVYGWALESIPESIGQSIGRSVRIRFDQPLASLESISRRQLYIR